MYLSIILRPAVFLPIRHWSSWSEEVGGKKLSNVLLKSEHLDLIQIYIVCFQSVWQNKGCQVNEKYHIYRDI